MKELLTLLMALLAPAAAAVIGKRQDAIEAKKIQDAINLAALAFSPLERTILEPEPKPNPKARPGPRTPRTPQPTPEPSIYVPPPRPSVAPPRAVTYTRPAVPFDIYENPAPDTPVLPDTFEPVGPDENPFLPRQGDAFDFVPSGEYIWMIVWDVATDTLCRPRPNVFADIPPHGLYHNQPVQVYNRYLPPAPLENESVYFVSLYGDPIYFKLAALPDGDSVNIREVGFGIDSPTKLRFGDVVPSASP